MTKEILILKGSTFQGRQYYADTLLNVADDLAGEMLAQGLAIVVTQDQADARAIADAFRQIYGAAMTINEVLGRDDALNETVPTDWPLQLSADEFAAECQGMVEHYDDLAKR